MNLWISFHEPPVEGLRFDSCSSFLFLVYFFDLCFRIWKGGVSEGRVGGGLIETTDFIKMLQGAEEGGAN